MVFSNCSHCPRGSGRRIVLFHPGCSAVPSLTFGDAERVVTARYKIVKCNEEIGIALSGSKQVLLGAPSDGFIQCLGFNIATIGAVQGL